MIIVRRADLTLQRMQAKVKLTGRPLRDLHGHKAMIELLEAATEPGAQPAGPGPQT